MKKGEYTDAILKYFQSVVGLVESMDAELINMEDDCIRII
jgi:hypothetical protein